MKDWVEVCPGIAVKEWQHQPADPKAKVRRHIVVRKQMSRRPQAGGKLLFEDQPDYRFSLFRHFALKSRNQATLATLRSYCLYLDSANGEGSGAWPSSGAVPAPKTPKESAKSIVTLRVTGAETAPLLIRKCCPPGGAIHILAIGGWVSQHARKQVLKLSLPRQKRPWLDAIFRKIDTLHSPFAYSTA